MPEFDYLKMDATALLGKIRDLGYDPAPLELLFVKGILMKIDNPEGKVTEENIKYLELILRRAMRNG